MFFLLSWLKQECVRLFRWESCGLLMHFLVSFLCVDAEDSSLTNKTERADTQRKQKTKGTNINIIPLPNLQLWPCRRALLIHVDMRLAVGQAGATAPWPLNALPNKAQKASNLDIGVRPRGSLLIYEKTCREL